MSADVLDELDVSRETVAKLEQFAELLRGWNRAINLVSKQSVSDLWSRHILDSAQLLRSADKELSPWVDLGSGGGLPGIVIAILLQPTPNHGSVTLIESDQRKAVFLETASRTLSLDTTVLNTRIETAPGQEARVISSRALAPLPDLLPLAQRHAHKRSTFLFHKGANHQAEIEDACAMGFPRPAVIPSTTDGKSVILKYQWLGEEL